MLFIFSSAQAFSFIFTGFCHFPDTGEIRLFAFDLSYIVKLFAIGISLFVHKIGGKNLIVIKTRLNKHHFSLKNEKKKHLSADFLP